MRLIMVAICLYMIWGYRAQARANTQPILPSTSSATSNTVKMTTPSFAAEKKFSMSIDLSYDSNLRAQNDPAFQANSTLVLAPRYHLFSKAALNARLDILQKHYANNETEVSNLSLAVARDPIKINATSDLKMSVSSLLPTNEIDRNDNSFLGALGTSLGAIRKHAIGGKSGSLDGAIAILKNFHEFEHTNLNDPNLSHRVRYILTLNQDLPSDLSFEVIGRYQTGWTYQNVLKTAFLLNEKLAWQVSPTTSLYISHSNDGDALAANGLDSNIKVYDERSSVWASGVEVSF